MQKIDLWRTIAKKKTSKNIGNKFFRDCDNLCSKYNFKSKLKQSKVKDQIVCFFVFFGGGGKQFKFLFEKIENSAAMTFPAQ